MAEQIRHPPAGRCRLRTLPPITDITAFTKGCNGGIPVLVKNETTLLPQLIHMNKQAKAIMFFCLSLLIAILPCVANDNDQLAYLKQCEECAQKYVHAVIAAEKQPVAFAEALKAIRDTIAQDKIQLDEDGDEDIPELRAKIYVTMQLELIQKTDLPPAVRTVFLDILGEGLVNDNVMWQKQHIVRFLSKYLWTEDKICISKKFIRNLEKAAKDKDNLFGKNMVLALGFVHAPSIKNILKKHSDFKPSDIFTTLNSSPGWGAVLIRAWRGEDKYIEKMIWWAEKEEAGNRCQSLFEDMSVVHQDACVKYLYGYLKSDKRLPPEWSSDPGDLMGGYAAFALSKMLDGFPECKDPYFYKPEELEPYRKWMKEQKTFKYKKKLSN